jgi:hypothetical protein
MRRLPGPADHRLGDGGDSRGSLRFVSGLAENTNSIFGADSSESQTANGCPVLLRAGTISREANVRSRRSRPKQQRALPPLCVKKTRAFLLTKTYMEGGDTGVTCKQMSSLSVGRTLGFPRKLPRRRRSPRRFELWILGLLPFVGEALIPVEPGVQIGRADALTELPSSGRHDN